MTGKLEISFKQDLDESLEKLNYLFGQFESGNLESAYIDEAFRHMHSIKSEAAHLELKEIAGIAHEAETLFQDMRQDQNSAPPLDNLYRLLTGLRDAAAIVRFPEQKSRAVDVKPPSKQNTAVRNSEGELFSEFEKLLLSESRDRGEFLYRLVCDFEAETEMKYPKAVLILNNLEQAVNIIKTGPDLSLPGKDSDYSSVEYYFTSHKPEGELFHALQVDQVQRVFLSRLQWTGHLPDSGTGFKRGSGERYESVTISIDQLSCLWFELLQGKSAFYLAGEGYGAPEQQTIYSALTGIERIIAEVGLIPFGEAFSDAPAVVAQAAEEQLKEARCEIIGGELSIERWLAQQLRDSVIQLLRNAVSHGIEDRHERVNNGKSPRGEVVVEFQRTPDDIILSIKDDGNGINEGIIRRRAAELGIREDQSLLQILTSPGFSTADDASMHSGRGVGLDIVAEKVNGLKGAGLELDSDPERGSRFMIRVPVQTASLKYLFVLHKRCILAIDESCVMGIEEPDTRAYSRDDQGFISYQNFPVYTCDGNLIISEGFPDGEVLLRVQAEKGIAYLLVEKVLFEESFPPDFVYGREVELSPLSALVVGNRETDIQIVNLQGLLDFSEGT